VTGAIDDLRADVERVIAEHNVRNIGWGKVGCLACEWSGQNYMHAAHVSERVMAMLTEKHGLREEHVGGDSELGIPKTRLVTAWRTDTGYPAHDDTDEGDPR
jgi:hypothetical protein